MFKKSLLILLLALSIPAIHAQTVAYVTNQIDNTVSVIDTATNTVTATIAVVRGGGPTGVVVSPDGTRAYVTNQFDDSISVIDTASNSVVATIPLAPFSFAEFLAITPDGKSLYVPDSGQNTLQVVSTVTNSVTNTISLPGITSAVAITPDGTRAYALLVGAVSVIDTATNTVVGSPIPVTSNAAGGLGNSGIAVTPGGGDVYLVGGRLPDVPVIATASNTVATTIPISGSTFLFGLAITPDGGRVYVSNASTNHVLVIDTATNSVEPSPIPVGNFPFSVAITPDGAFVYVPNGNDRTVSVIATATNTVVGAPIPVGRGSMGIAISGLNAPFASFPAPTPSNTNNANKISLSGSLSLGANSSGLDFAHQPMTLTVGSFSLLFPAGTVTQVGNSSQQHFTFSGTLNGLSVTFDLIGNSPNFTYSFTIQGKNVGTQVGPSPVTLTLAIGNNTGTATF
jgi:YVTN family beta-propeller protein